ncbi:unnamed protein product [Parnassius mnemosyne]|uniref:Meckel syndrome type 1 protein n=1 Tax=Parnassius mnemosyne TaxID=213953 RepID=A0AAV1L3R1_9NEOP
MFDFNRNNKRTEIYWLKQPVTDLKIKIKFKPQSSIISLPKYEDFVTTSNKVNLEKVDTDKVEEYVFKWQEKVFSAWEINHYKEIHNCISNADLCYNGMLKSREYEAQKVFTYVNQDNHLPSPLNWKKSANKSFFNLNSCLEKLNLEDRIGRVLGNSSSTHHLFRSDENITTGKEQWIAMHVVLDDSLYTDDSQLLVKQEYVLLSLYYNVIENYLIVTPDANDLMVNPYDVVMEAGSSDHQYGVEIIFEELESDEELVTLLNNLYKKWENKHKRLLNFVPPPLGRTKVYVTFEILSATDFELDNIYIEYEIKIPEEVICESSLHGRTHVSKGMINEDSSHWSYGHIIELELEISIEIDAPPLQMFFEVISTDWWGRHRTEGYCYLPLLLSSGYNTKRLSCTRPEEKNKVEADSRRFFVGGCHLIKDLEVLSKPQLQSADFTYTATGYIDVRWSTVKQVHELGGQELPAPAGSSSSSALLQGAEAVLRQYSQARARLAAATKDLADGDG